MLHLCSNNAQHQVRDEKDQKGYILVYMPDKISAALVTVGEGTDDDAEDRTMIGEAE